MSKERELLKEALKVLEWNGIMGSHDTYNSIKELLAQPEQTEQKPLSDGAICQILLKKEWRGFVDLVRIIEKAHGIGGGDE